MTSTAAVQLLLYFYSYRARLNPKGLLNLGKVPEGDDEGRTYVGVTLLMFLGILLRGALWYTVVHLIRLIPGHTANLAAVFSSIGFVTGSTLYCWLQKNRGKGEKPEKEETIKN